MGQDGVIAGQRARGGELGAGAPEVEALGAALQQVFHLGHLLLLHQPWSTQGKHSPAERHSVCHPVAHAAHVF